MRLPLRRPQFFVAMCLLAAVSAATQQPDSPTLTVTGQATIDGRQIPYRIRHLPVSSFPRLPSGIAAALTQRRCLIPQTYQAHRPENVVRGSFERPGSSDWAVLCSVNGAVSLLVFFSSSPDQPTTLATAQETDRLQPSPGASELGFNWGIDPASPQTIHDAQIGLSPRPPHLDHDALADSVIDRKTIYHYFKSGAWSFVDLPD